MHPIFYMLEKEFLQHKIVTRLPLFVLAFTILLSLFIIFNFDANVEFSISGIGNDQILNLQEGVIATINFGAMIVSFLLSTLYLSKAICGDRQDGSIAFWRSMPISDLSTQLVKLGFALLIIPLVCSMLVLSADLFLWILSIFSPDHVKFLIGDISFLSVLQNYFSFLMNMFFIGIALLPFACVIFAVSQLSESPLLITLIGIYALKVAFGLIFPMSGLDHFVYQFINLPTSLLFTNEPVHFISQLSIIPIVSMYVIAGAFFIVSLSIQKHGEFRIKHVLQGYK
ncbi:membrane protein [Psychromonas marina]|uniref:Membrane protein n=1 Tax=Psychromonas marina TaxID=88364 RepID=A0ABQ6E5M2_9GAMM|nr:hypothetical protein [Psychromonas marina]GLS92702.1 membrane protein [Psychromonas marina]